jgi:hypothetical protein
LIRAKLKNVNSANFWLLYYRDFDK